MIESVQPHQSIEARKMPVVSRIDDNQEELAFLLDLGIETNQESVVSLAQEKKAGFIVTNDESEAVAYFESLGIDLALDVSDRKVEEDKKQQPLDDESEVLIYLASVGMTNIISQEGLAQKDTKREESKQLQAQEPQLTVKHAAEKIYPLTQSQINKVKADPQYFPNPNTSPTSTKQKSTLAKKNSVALSDLVVVNNVDTANAGAKQIKAALDSMDMVAGTFAKAIEAHMAACTGMDGHRSRRISKEQVSLARESAYANIMSTDIGKKLSKGEVLDEKETQALNEIVSLSYETELDIDTSVIRNQAVDLRNFDQITMLMPNLVPEHVHGAGCNHGGEAIDMSGMGSGNIFSDQHALDSIFGSSHDHHDKLFYCDKCKKASKIHVHSKKDIKCAGCDSSRNMRELKGRHH